VKLVGLPCTVDVITWLDATFVSVGIKSAALSSLPLLLLILLGLLAD
jgi:hypothetical protein